jgi:hypothetical protein
VKYYITNVRKFSVLKKNYKKNNFFIQILSLLHLLKKKQPEAFNAELLEFLSSEPIITMVNSIKEPNANLFV